MYFKVRGSNWDDDEVLEPSRTAQSRAGGGAGGGRPLPQHRYAVTPREIWKFYVKMRTNGNKISYTLFSFQANCNFDPDFWSQMVL